MRLSSQKKANGAKDNLVGGFIEFKKPYVLENVSTGADGWKKELMDAYGGKTGKELSAALKSDGYDGVITLNTKGGYVDEVVSLGANEKKLLPKADNALAKEAKKFKSADEFIKGGMFSEARDSNVRAKIRGAMDEVVDVEATSVLIPDPQNQKLDMFTVGVKEEAIEGGARPYILVKGENVVDGHHSLQAYKNLGFDEVPAVQWEDLVKIWQEANK